MKYIIVLIEILASALYNDAHQYALEERNWS